MERPPHNQYGPALQIWTHWNVLRILIPWSFLRRTNAPLEEVYSETDALVSGGK